MLIYLYSSWSCQISGHMLWGMGSAMERHKGPVLYLKSASYDGRNMARTSIAQGILLWKMEWVKQ